MSSKLVPFLLARITEDADLAVSMLLMMQGFRTRTAADPRRTLAECWAKRRIMELHHPDQLTGEDPSTGVGSSWDCAECCEDYPCPTLRIMAAVYSDHEDYDSAWAWA